MDDFSKKRTTNILEKTPQM